jgi:hypothetical protein
VEALLQTFFFKKKAKLSNQVVSVDNVLQCLCSSVPLFLCAGSKRRVEDMKEKR